MYCFDISEAKFENESQLISWNFPTLASPEPVFGFKWMGLDLNFKQQVVQ